MGAMPVAHTFDLTHSPYGSLVHQQKTRLQPTRLFFCRFFLAQKKQATPTPQSTNATNRRAARAVAKHKTTHQETHLYVYMGGVARAYPRVWAAGACARVPGFFGRVRCGCHPLRVLRMMPVCGVRVGNDAPSASDLTGDDDSNRQLVGQ